MGHRIQLQTSPELDNAKTFIGYDQRPVVNADGSVDGDFDEGGTNENGYKAYQNVDDNRRVFVLVRKAGYVDGWIDGDDHQGVLTPHEDLLRIGLQPAPPPPLPELQIRGLDFVEHGRRVTIIETTNFLQFYRVAVNQEDPGPSLYPGFNMDRVSVTLKWIPEQLGWAPLNLDIPTLQRVLPEFLAWRRQIRRRVELTVLCDMRDLGVPKEQQAAILNAVYEVVDDYRDVAIIEDGNEVLDSEQQLDLPYLMSHVNHRRVLYSTGSGTSGDPVPEPYGLYCTPHLVRPSMSQQAALSKMLADGNFGEQVYGSWAAHPTPTLRPMLTNETKGAGESDSDSRYTDPNIAKELARIMRGRNGGAFHATDAVYSRPLGPKQEASRAAFIEGSTD